MGVKLRTMAGAEMSTGNVFADLGLPNPERELLKARLTLEIYRIVRARGLKQAEAGKILGIKQPHVSALMRNRSGTFSVERLMEFLAALGQDVRISVKPARGKQGRVSLAACGCEVRALDEVDVIKSGGYKSMAWLSKLWCSQRCQLEFGTPRSSPRLLDAIR